MSSASTPAITNTSAGLPLPLYLTRPFYLSDEWEALCRIAAKVLADRSPTPDAWVCWSPTAPLTASLTLLIPAPLAHAAWQCLVLRGWMQTRIIGTTLYLRLTPLGQQLVQLPPPSLLHAPLWYRAVLDHLYS